MPGEIRGTDSDRLTFEEQSRNARFWTERVPGPGEQEVDQALIAARVAWSRREHGFVTAHRATFEQTLL